MHPIYNSIVSESEGKDEKTYPHGLLRVPRVLEHGLLVFGHELHELPPAVVEAPGHRAEEERQTRHLEGTIQETLDFASKVHSISETAFAAEFFLSTMEEYCQQIGISFLLNWVPVRRTASPD